MSKLVVRHGLSEANYRENYGAPAFGNPEAPLMPQGRQQATELGGILTVRYGIDVSEATAAVSMMRRSQETAIVAGFRKLSLYPELNEEKGGTSDQDMRAVLHKRRAPEATIAAARQLLENPPVELVWVTHALLIATLCQELGVYSEERFTPKFCEVRELPI